MINRRTFLAGTATASLCAATPAAAAPEFLKKLFAPKVAVPKVPLVIMRQRTQEIWAGEVSPTKLKKEDHAALNHLLRDTDANVATEMDPELLYYAALLQAQMDAPHLLALSAYRTSRTNRRMRGARDSYHMKGMAVDLRVPGHGAWDIGRAARTVGVGGVGTYRRGFTHIDTGPKRTWRG